MTRRKLYEKTYKTNLPYYCLVAALHASRAQLHLVEIALGAPGQIRAERRLQLGRGAAVDDLRRGGEGVRFHIDIPQILAHAGAQNTALSEHEPECAAGPRAGARAGHRFCGGDRYACPGAEGGRCRACIAVRTI